MLNSCIIQGRLTAAPELQHTQSGTAFVRCTVACDRDITKDGNRECDFIPVIVWGKAAEFMTGHFGKGGNIVIAGRWEVSNYEKDGEKRSSHTLHASNLYFAGDSKKDAQSDTYTRSGEFQYIDGPDEDLPY